MSRVRRHLFAAVAGTSVGAAYTIYSRKDVAETALPRPPPNAPAHLLADSSLLTSRLLTDDFAALEGLWLAWYNGPLALRLTTDNPSSSSQQPSLRGRHLTGSYALPAGRDAFSVRADGVEVHGQHYGSALPFGLWPNAAPCRLNAYHADLRRQSIDRTALSLDIYPFSWLTPIRVPLRRVPESAHIETDANGFLRSGSKGLEAAQAAIAQAAFDEARTY